ncbi:MAG TPA: tripartite tricarboxylate transporter substrate binding protein [Burkholderiales bacterium]|nr:tripartite tricarboxylate transporter substrate binding protein [Burkholderiales bacterium]
MNRVSSRAGNARPAISRRAIERFAVASSLSLLAMTCGAQDTYPSKPIRFLVGQSPGGATDIVARMVAVKMTDPLGQNIVVENRTGAAGSIAATTVAKSPPDGYTLLVVSSSYSINPSLYSNLPFDPQKDLAPISLFAEAPFLLVVHPSVPARNVKDLVALAKASPGTLSFGSGGNGSSGHLAGALFESLTRTQLLHVPYKGAGLALVDVVSGQVSFMFASVLSSTPHVKQQRLRVLAVTGTKRSPALPNVPTVAEAGVPGYSTSTWYGLLAPAGTRPQVVERLAAASSRALHAPDLRERLLADGAEPNGSTPAVFQKHIAHEMAKWREVVKRAGVTLQ